jgi:hypothetical protein
MYRVSQNWYVTLRNGVLLSTAVYFQISTREMHLIGSDERKATCNENTIC